jgi:hypothetical protein
MPRSGEPGATPHEGQGPTYPSLNSGPLYCLAPDTDEMGFPEGNAFGKERTVVGML